MPPAIIRSFLLRAGDVARFSVKRSDDFDVSDCTILPPADLLLLERSYSPARGVAMRIRRIPLAAHQAGRGRRRQPLIEADLGYQIDNMEGIAVHRNARGETILTLVSDDNFSVLQRNLLLQFTLVESSRGAPERGVTTPRHPEVRARVVREPRRGCERA